MKFEEEYFETGIRGYRGYNWHAHFGRRALWISYTLNGRILEVGCAYGYVLMELYNLGMLMRGVDISEYAKSKADPRIRDNIITSDIAELIIEEPYDWIISWEVLDSLSSDEHVKKAAKVMNEGSHNQFHYIHMYENPKLSKNRGNLARTYEYWRELLPNAYLKGSMDYAEV